MGVTRTHRKQNNFTQLDNTGAEDTRLTLRAKGLLWYLMTKPDGWQIRNEHLRRTFNIGRDQLRSVFQEMEDAGYLIRVKFRDPETGKFDWVTEVFETPEDCEMWRCRNQELLDRAEVGSTNCRAPKKRRVRRKPTSIDWIPTSGQPAPIVITESVITDSCNSSTVESESPEGAIAVNKNNSPTKDTLAQKLRQLLGGKFLPRNIQGYIKQCTIDALKYVVEVMATKLEKLSGIKPEAYCVGVFKKVLNPEPESTKQVEEPAPSEEVEVVICEIVINGKPAYGEVEANIYPTYEQVKELQPGAFILLPFRDDRGNTVYVPHRFVRMFSHGGVACVAARHWRTDEEYPVPVRLGDVLLPVSSLVRGGDLEFSML